MLEGKIIAVLGASEGIGYGFARYAAEQGAKGLILGARSKEKLEALAEDLKNKYSTQTLVIPTDVTEARDVDNFLNQSFALFDHVDAVVNSVGLIQEETPLEEMPPAEISRYIYLNLTQALVVGHYLMPKFKKQGFGTYVVISSHAAQKAFKDEEVYCASKAGISQGIRALDVSLSGSGKPIYAFVLEPGFINTEEAKRKFPQYKKDIENSPTPHQFAKSIAEVITNPAATRLKEKA